MAHHSRRDFMRLTCCSAAGAALVGGLSKFGLVSAMAQGTTDYKALVCIFLFGGNDANNMVIPIDATGYSNYQKARANLALSQNQVLPLQSGNQANFALHPNMPELQSLFNNQKNLAILANVGTLVQPTTQAQYQQYTNLPVNLYSHSDQQDQWQSAQLSGAQTVGWAGKVADSTQATYNGSAQFPPVLSINGNAIFCTGDTTRPFTMTPYSTPGLSGFDSSATSQARFQATQQLLTFDSGLSLVQSANTIASDAVQYGITLASALQNVTPLSTQFSNSYLSQQLRQVAQVIAVRSALGLGRQIFFCSTGGFDTHSDELPQHVQLMSDLSQSMNSFYQATQELGVANNVTTFTLSEFNRTLQPGSNEGTDHAWGSHQLIQGGAVKGNNFYGAFPTLALGGPNDAGSNGRWIPTTALDQYAATLATWFGVTSGDLPTIFPNLANFTVNNLGFV